MKAETQIEFVSIIESDALVVSGGAQMPNTEKPFADFLIKSNGDESTSDLHEPSERLNTSLNESQEIVDNDSILTGSPKSKSDQKISMLDRKEPKKDHLIHQGLSEKLPSKLKALNNQTVNNSSVKVDNSGIISDVKSKQVSGIELRKGIRLDNRNNVNELKT
ncbi:MAG: hypothetical protein KAX28_07930, partial [Candidatus Marinimicrobia bacterium]|nr:hypothetical protein [Candidatus Neomarinimicrobiota bacterium]